MAKLRNTRKKLGLTQTQAATAVGVSRRTYQYYESEEKRSESRQAIYAQLLSVLEEYGTLDRTHGILGQKTLIERAREVFSHHPKITCAYLFGSYARKEATPKSDVDIVVVIDEAMGLEFFGIIAELEDALHKDVDLLTHNQVCGSPNLLSQILEEGKKIYG